jgi:hypothetical protein
MKLFMGPVLFRMAERDAFRHDAEAHPPDRQPRQAPQPRPGKRAAIVAADADGQPVLGKRPRKRRRVTSEERVTNASQRSTKRLKPSRKVRE